MKRASELLESSLKGETPWSFLSFYRDPVFTINDELDGFPTRIRGDRVSMGSTPDNRNRYLTTQVSFLSILLSYNVDIWASKETRVQELAIRLISKLTMESPVLLAPINPGGELARFDLLDHEWVDNSDLESETEQGKIYRHTISFDVDAKIKRVVNRSVKRFEYKDIPVINYEGDDLDNEECKECDWQYLESQGSPPNP